MFITNSHKIVFVLLFSVFAVDFTRAEDSSRLPSEKAILVGVNYFAGWWKPLPNKWIGPDGKDWREKYPGRLPLLGEYRLTLDDHQFSARISNQACGCLQAAHTLGAVAPVATKPQFRQRQTTFSRLKRSPAFKCARKPR